MKLFGRSRSSELRIETMIAVAAIGVFCGCGSSTSSPSTSLRNELVEWRVHVWLELWGLFELRR